MPNNMSSNEMINVGFDCNFLGGGIGIYAKNLIKGVLSNTNDIKYRSFFSALKGKYEPFLDKQFSGKYSVRCYRFPSRLIQAIMRNTPLPAFEKLAGRIDLYHAMNEEYTDVDKDKLVVTAHGFLCLKHPELTTEVIVNGFRNNVLPMLNRASKIVAPTQIIKDEIINDLKIEPDKVSIVKHGYDSELYYPDSRDIESKNPYILYFGGIVPHKNIIRIMQAFKLLADKKKDMNYKLILVGHRGWKSKQIYECADRISMGDKIHFMGYKKDNKLAQIVQHATCFISPSIYESFCFPALEAIACGIPAIVSENTGAAEIVQDAGILVNPYDVDEIAAAIYSVISDNEYRQSLSKKAIERAQNFSWQKCAKETLGVYKEVLNTQ